MRQSIKTFILALLFSGNAGHCCINEYRALLNGDLVYTDKHNASPIGRFNSNNKAFLLKKLHETDSIYKLTGKIEDYSDLGSMLVYNGLYWKAKQIFEEIEKKLPGLYATASNLGTIYELLGKNDSAFFWIKKAIEINPNSHNGSEWIHLKILELKVQRNDKKSHLITHSVLGLDFGDSKIPENKNNLDLNFLRRQLYDQLNERISFIKPKDPIMSQLLFDLGNITAIVADVKSALQIYKTAAEYGYSSKLFDQRLAYFSDLQLKADEANERKEWENAHPRLRMLLLAPYPLTFLVVLFLLYRFIINRKRKKSKNI